MVYCLFLKTQDGYSEMINEFKHETEACVAMGKLVSENRTSWKADGTYAEVWACEIITEPQDHKGYIGIIYEKIELIGGMHA